MIEADQRYVIDDEVLTAHLAGEAVLLHMRTRKYFRLNETAAAIWKRLEASTDRAGILARLCAEFDVEPQEAAGALGHTIEMLAARKLIRPTAVAKGEGRCAQDE